MQNQGMIYGYAQSLDRRSRPDRPGATADRSQLHRLMVALSHGDVVIITVVDRLSRDTTDLLVIARQRTALGTTLFDPPEARSKQPSRRHAETLASSEHRWPVQELIELFLISNTTALERDKIFSSITWLQAKTSHRPPPKWLAGVAIGLRLSSAKKSFRQFNSSGVGPCIK